MLQNERAPDYKKWVVTGECMPQVAASLILGINPDIAVIKDSHDWQNVRVRFKEVEELSYLLCDKKGPWYYYRHTIFEHIEHALKNLILIDKQLMNEIMSIYSNYTLADQKRFIELHPYIAKNLNLSLPTFDSDFSDTERNTMLKIILGMAIDAYGYVPKHVRNNATGSKRGSIKAGIRSVGLEVSDDTIRDFLTEAATKFPDTKPHKP